MMKVMEIADGRTRISCPQYASAEEARKYFAPNIQFIDVPDWVGVGWKILDGVEGDGKYLAPELPEGWVWDEQGHPYNAVASRETERNEMINRADRDVLEAYRSRRAGDTTIDWDSWIDSLENFVSEVRATIMQENYPIEVVYPEYPTKPTK